MVAGNSSPQATIYEKKNKSTIFAFTQRAFVIGPVFSGEEHVRNSFPFHYKSPLRSDTSAYYAASRKMMDSLKQAMRTLRRRPNENQLLRK